MAPDHKTPFLEESTVRSAQADADRRYAALASAAAESLGAPSEVRAGSTVTEAINAALEERADIVVLQAPRAGLWRRLARRGPADHLLADVACAVLLVPRTSRR